MLMSNIGFWHPSFDRISLLLHCTDSLSESSLLYIFIRILCAAETCLTQTKIIWADKKITREHLEMVTQGNCLDTFGLLDRPLGCFVVPACTSL